MYTELKFTRAVLASKSLCLLIVVVCFLPIAIAQQDVASTSKAAGGNSIGTKHVMDDALVLGSVENQDGTTIENAKVWLVGGSYDDPKTFGQTTTDSNGQFAFDDLPDEETVFKDPGSLNVWAQHPTEGLGWFNGLYKHKRKPLTVKLGPIAKFNGQLVGPAGQPLPGVRITPRYLSAKRLNDRASRAGRLSPEMSQRLSTTTTDDGKFVIEDLPVDGVVNCDVAAPGFDQLRVSWNLHEPLIIRLDPGVSFSGRLIWPEEIKIPAEEDFELGMLTLTGYSQFQADGSVSSDGKKAAFGTQTTYTVKINNEGQFHLDHIAAGQYYISAKLSRRLPLLLSESERLEIKPETPIDDFELVAEKAFKISGKVVGFENKDPIADAVVQFMSLRDGGLRYSGRVTTDQAGEFFAYTKKGKHILKVVEAPREFIPTADSYDSEFAKSRSPTIDVTEDTVCPDLELDQACDVTIEVFDENGKPAAGAIVKIVTVAGYPAGQDYQTEQRTDAEGKFVARRVTKNDTLPICVRTPTAISELDLVITPSELKGPVRVDLAPDHGFRFRCRVVDREGEPIVGANVTVGTYFFYVSKWIDGERGSAISGSAGQGKTDAEGYFETGPLWPDRDYFLNAKAEGYDQSEAPRAKGKRGQIVELKPMVLSKIKAAKIVGIVVDSSKQPVEDVLVYSAGNGYQQATTRTNASGQFELDDVAADVRYVFADGGVDYRLGGKKFGRQQPLEITIRSKDSPSIGSRELRIIERGEQLEMASELIDQALSLPGDPRMTSRLAILRALVQVDDQKAVEESLDGGGVFEYMVRVEQAKQVVDDDAERALEILQSVPNRYGISTAISLAMRLSKSKNENDKEMALQFAELALKLAGRRTDYHPRLAIVFTSLGQHEKAQSLIENVLEKIDLDNLNDDQKSTVIRLAPAVAPYDFERARSFASLAKEGYSRTYAMADVALAIVETDHEKTIREIDALTGDSNAPNIRDKARYRAAYLLVETNPDLAIKLVRQCEDNGNRAQALGRLAVRVAEFDKPQAWEMIDSALAIHRANPNSYRSWSNFGGAGPFAAAFAYHAKQVDYPDMESVIWHVRAACRANAERGQDRLSATIKTARILALVDRIAARDLLNSIVGKTDQISREEGGVSLYDQWLQAWLMVDFGRGVKLLGEELDEIKESGAKNRIRYGHGEVFRLLVSRPNERFNVLLRETGLWKLQEDGSLENR